jgi:hypothetical protein
MPADARGPLPRLIRPGWLNEQGASTATGADLIQYTCERDAMNEWFSWVVH